MIKQVFTMTGNDSELVGESLSGHRDAFGRIVDRYKSLVCSLAYSATGSLSQSEDLAQETFVTAWKQLPELREPSKLRPWLCAIARNLIGKALRQGGREPVHNAEPLPSQDEFSSDEPLPPEQIITREEEAILWRSLERIPEIYRESLILFYREGQSVGRVATELDISEDAVKQRLSRGRKLLANEVTAFVEGALRQSAPGKAFTLGVLAALPLINTSAKAAILATAAAKGGGIAKAGVSSSLVNGILGPVLMFLGTYFGYRLDRDTAQSPRAREFVNRYYRVLVTCIATFMLAVLSLTLAGGPLMKSEPVFYAGLLIGLGATYVMVLAGLTLWMRSRWRKLQMAEEQCAQAERAHDFRLTPFFEYRSRLSLLGWPLIHIRIRGGLERGPVKAWIAAGDSAVGILFAFGAVAIAPISFGGLSLGLVTLGGLAVGLLPFGGFSFGPWALGGFAAGWQAFGGCAVAWSAAQGGVAVARDFAQGAVALARHANDVPAEAYFADSGFFQNVQVVMRYVQWLNLLWLLPLVLWWRHKKKL